MNIIKKIGLTALAGSLVAFSVNAADMSVTGSAGISLGSQEGSDTGNGFSSGDSINFSGTSELDNGWTITAALELDGGAQASDTVGASQVFDDRSIAINMGDSGTLTFHGHGASSALGAVDDVMPTAYGETWDVLAASTEVGAVAESNAIGSGSSDNMWVYNNSTLMDGTSVTISYVPSGTAEAESSVDIALAYTGYDGLTVGYAAGEENAVAGTGSFDVDTMYATYAYGPVTVGYQVSEIEGNNATNTDEATYYGVTYAITDSFSVGYGESTIDLGSSTTDQETTNISFSYTMGGMTLAGAFIDQENSGGDTNTVNDRKGYEFDLAFAF
jgi:outer membrane protein OmpU